jgi:putative transcriptional regulator
MFDHSKLQLGETRDSASKTKTTKPRKYRSPLLASIHETAKGLDDAGVMEKETMRRFDVMCLTQCAAYRKADSRPSPAREGQPSGLRSLSERHHRLSQPVGARRKTPERCFPKAPYLNR